jgi:very-short-patch-repair endonuclease
VREISSARARLAIEVDGAIHNETLQQAHDAKRDTWLRSQGITVYRVSASSVFQDPVAVADGVRLLADELIREAGGAFKMSRG